MLMELMYNPASAPCRAVLMCIEELGLRVDLRKIDMQRKMEHMMAWFQKLNPQHTVPTLDDNGFILWESRAILQYLVSAHGRPAHDHLYPVADHQRRATIDRLLQFDICLSRAIHDYFEPVLSRGGEPDDAKANALKQALDYLDGFLRPGRYAVDDTLSVADLSLLATVGRLEAFQYRIDSYASLAAWKQRLTAQLPYYERCNAQGLQLERQLVTQSQLRR